MRMNKIKQSNLYNNIINLKNNALNTINKPYS